MSDSHHLVHFNLATAREPLDHPRMADFVAQLDAVNPAAAANPDFVWTLEADEAGNATALLGSDRALPNLSVWRSLAAPRRFVYEGVHAEALDRRTEWFEPPRGPAYVLWWIPAGHRPDWNEAKRRLDRLAAAGPTPHAFTFVESFGAPDTEPRRRPATTLDGTEPGGGR